MDFPSSFLYLLKPFHLFVFMWLFFNPRPISQQRAYYRKTTISEFPKQSKALFKTITFIHDFPEVVMFKPKTSFSNEHVCVRACVCVCVYKFVNATHKNNLKENFCTAGSV